MSSSSDGLYRISQLEQRISLMEDYIKSGGTVSVSDILSIKDEICRLKIAYVEQDRLLDKLEHRVDINNQRAKPVYQSEYTRNLESNKPKKNYFLGFNDINIAKLAMPLAAAILIILAAVVFVGAMWGEIPDILKAGLLVIIGYSTNFIGLKLYEKYKLYPYLILSSIGVSIAFIGIISARVFYNVIGTVLTVLLIIIWIVINYVQYYKYQELGMLIVANIGMVISSLLVCAENVSSTSIWPYFIVNTVLVCGPIICNYVPKLSDRFGEHYENISYKISKIGIAVYLISMIDKFDCLSKSSMSYDFGIAAIFISGILLAYLASNSLSLNNTLPKFANYVVSFGIIQTSLWIPVVVLNEIGLNSVMNPILFLINTLIIIGAGFKNKYNYILVSMNIPIAVYGISDMILDVPYDCIVLIISGVLVNLLINFVSNIKSEYKFEKLVSSIILTFTVFVTSLDMPRISDFKGEEILWFTLTLLLAIITVMYNTTKDNYDSIELNILNSISKIFMDIAILTSLLSVYSDVLEYDTVMCLGSVYLLITKYLLVDKYKDLYNLLFCGLLILYGSISSICYLLSYDNIVLFMISTVALIITYLLYIFRDNTLSIIRIIALLCGFFSTMLLCFGIVDDLTYLVSIIMILASSIMVTMGFVAKYKDVRVASLVIFLIFVFKLVFDVMNVSNTLLMAVGLFVGGIIVLGVSLIYFKLEKYIKNKNLEE